MAVSPIQGLHPSKDPAFAIFEGKSFRETCEAVSTVSNGMD